MLDIGCVLDEKYEIVDILGKGGMGTVYLCKNIRLGNLWAIKEIRQDIKNIDILTEANILKNLSHSGIRRIVDMFYENNYVYMVQDYVDGQTLKEYVKKNGRMQTERICRFTLELCDIIGYLHNLNPAIIYRDIKPSNIMITPNEKVILIDFGISKVYRTDTEQDTVCAGSNGYAAPEQYGVGKSCTQTDIYGIGMLVYFMVKGESPFTGVEPLLEESYDSHIDDDLKRIIQKCVKIDIKDRYSSIEVLKNEIIKVSQKDKYEKTAILSESNFSVDAVSKKIKTRNDKKGKLKKSTKGILYFIVGILASIYILQGNKKESINKNIADKPEITRSIADTTKIEEQPSIIPIEEAAMDIKQESTSKEATMGSMQNSTIKEEVPPLSKSKSKGKEKKKSKHSKEY